MPFTIHRYQYRKNKSFLADTDTDTRCFNRYHTDISRYKPILADTDILIILNRYRYSFKCSYRYRYAYSYRYRYIGTWYRYEYLVSVEPYLCSALTFSNNTLAFFNPKTMWIFWFAYCPCSSKCLDTYFLIPTKSII